MVVLLLLVVEVLYLDLDPVSVGFPFRSVEYGAEHLHVGEPSAMLRIEPTLFAIDVAVACLLGFLLLGCVPTSVLVLVVQGCALGTIAGAVFSSLMELSPESWLSQAVALIVIFLVVPVAIYVFSIGHRWQKRVIIVLSGVTVFTLYRALFVVEGLFDGFIEDDASFGLLMALGLLAITLYLGYHFSTARKIREDPFFATDMIWSELERLEVPSQNLSIKDVAESHEGL